MVGAFCEWAIAGDGWGEVQNLNGSTLGNWLKTYQYHKLRINRVNREGRER
jgi:hypothetical protein